MKKAYCIVNIVKVSDAEQFRAYVRGHVPTLERYGGRFLVKGQTGEVLEGAWPGNVIVIHEFPDMEALRRWYGSEEYRPWKALRQSCVEANVIITEGV